MRTESEGNSVLWISRESDTSQLKRIRSTATRFPTYIYTREPLELRPESCNFLKLVSVRRDEYQAATSRDRSVHSTIQFQPQHPVYETSESAGKYEVS